MTLEQFILLQGHLMDAFGWLVRWWLIGLLAGGVFCAVLTFTVIVTRETLSKF